MKRTLVLGIGCIAGWLASRILSRAVRSDDAGAAAPMKFGFASITAATSIAGSVSDALDIDPDDHIRAFGIGFATGMVLTACAGPIARTLGRIPAPAGPSVN